MQSGLFLIRLFDSFKLHISLAVHLCLDACEKSDQWLWEENCFSTDQCSKAGRRTDASLSAMI